MLMLKLLRYNKTISILSATLQQASTELLNITLGILLVIGAFASFCNQYFGSYVEDYRSLHNTLAALVSGSMGYTKYKAVEESAGLLGALMLLFYLMTMMYFMFNFFVSILNEFLSEMRDDPRAQPKHHEVIEHMMTVIRQNLGLVDLKSKARQEELRKKST